MKRLFLFVFLLSTLGCTHYFIRDSSAYNLTKEELEFLKSKKIGLIGFYPFEFYETSVKLDEHISSESLNINKEQHKQILQFVDDNTKKENVLDGLENNFFAYRHTKYGILKQIVFLRKDHSTVQFLDFGEEIKLQQSENVNLLVKEKNLKDFLRDYLLRTKHLGLEILEPLLIFYKSRNNSIDKIQFKNLDKEFLIVAYHGPPLQKKKSGIGMYVLNVFITSCTAWTFPLMDEWQAESMFAVYDKNLNLIKVFEYKYEINMLSAWWILSGRSYWMGVPPANTYEPDIKQFSKELVQVLKK
jgi:hypothetical protein